MPSRSDVLGEQLEELTQDLRDVWRTLTADPKKQARKERAWGILTAVLGAVATMAARRAAAKAWRVLTGEQPPIGRPAPPQPAPHAGDGLGPATDGNRNGGSDRGESREREEAAHPRDT